MKSIRYHRNLLLIVVLLLCLCDWLPAAPPEQFRVWGTIGAEFPPVPPGWTEVQSATEGLPPLSPMPEEQRRGYVLFARDPLLPIAPDSAPAPSERVTELKTFAAQGEYEPLSFAVHALDDLNEVKVEVSDLRSAGGSMIPVEFVDVRIARCVRVVADAKAKTYRLQPFLLEKRPTFAVSKGKSAQVWLTLKVPDMAKAGDYTGTVSVRTAVGNGRCAVPLLVKILPFALPPAPIEMVMSYPRPSDSDEMLLKELIDQREHGISGVEAIGVQIASRDRKFGEDDVAATRTYCKRLIDAAKKVYGGWRFPVTFEVGHQIAYYWDANKNWFAHWQHSKEIDDDFVKAMQVVTDLAKAEGLPSLRAYALDEAGAHNLLDEAVYYYRLIKQRMPQVTTWTTIGGGMAMGHDEIGQLSSSVDLLNTNRFTPEIAQALVARGKPFGVYNGSGNTPAGARFFFGFYGWKTGAQQILQWTYHFGDSVFKGNGFRQEDEGFVYHAPDGPLPSVAWEAVREGIDDYRYVHLLWQMIAAAKAANKPTAREAEQTLNQLLRNIGWGFQAMQSSDRTPPPHPSTLRKWRWQIAGQILKLKPLVGANVGADVSASPVKAARPSPLDLAWTEPEKEEGQFGPEILPPSDFETAMKPFRVEVWNGKGKGELDANERHSGKQSVRIEVPADQSSNAVTVLLWPSYGGGGLNLTLEGDRIYQFSAWVKVKDRGTLPDLRLSLPGGTAKMKTGKDKLTPDGWQRIYVRAEMTSRAQPNYIAVWVQGTGTVWVDDLSLREVVPPPLNVALDQNEYDSLDKVGVATLTIAKRITPAQVRFTLSLEGKTVAELTSPFQPQHSISSATGALTLIAPATLSACRFVFDPSSLVPGNYAAKVELLDQQGRRLAAKALTFQRQP